MLTCTVDHADRFPFVLSILTGFTFILKSVMSLSNLTRLTYLRSIIEWRQKGNVITARPVTEIVILGAMVLAWTSKSYL
jgi:hypothetical protein